MTRRRADNKMLDRRTVELVLISLLAAFCGGLAWALGHELFAVAFAAAAVTGAFGVVATLVGSGGGPPNWNGPSPNSTLKFHPRRSRPAPTNKVVPPTHHRNGPSTQDEVS